MRARLIRSLLRVFAALPLPLAHAIGAVIGAGLMLVPNDLRRISRINIPLCLPGLTRAALVAGARRERRGTRARRAATGPRPHSRHASPRRVGDDGPLQLRALSAHEPLSSTAHARDGRARAPRP